ncbi:hypothetical protein Taro_042269 [Colocasia esculenta]|uniref:Uncharacterized protein n=1 Tax=Colocasia esculenta TaxID=4460 RepID=A0A843X291_COLES|nr:hypothetical protein [Colocasia esculenta]
MGGDANFGPWWGSGGSGHYSWYQSEESTEICKELITIAVPKEGLFHARFCCGATSDLEVCYWLGWCVLEGFSQSGALVVLVEILPGPACVASAVLLVAVFSLMVRVVWSFGLCILVKVLPRIALRRFWWRFFPGVLRVCFGPPLRCSCGSKCAVWLGCVLVRFSQDSSWHFLVEVLPKSAWALSVKVLCPWPCVWLPRWPACLVSRFQVSRLRWWDCVSPWLGWFASFFVPHVLLQIVVW